MKIQILVVGVLLMRMTSPSSAQPSESFFPRHIGDRWDYVYSNGGFIGPLILTRDSIGTDSSHNLFYNNFVSYPLYRIDTAQNVFWIPQDPFLNYLRYKLTADSGQVWENPQSGMLRWAWVARIDSAVVFSRRTVVKVFRYAPGNPGGLGALEEDWLASGFGLIYRWREPNDITYLRGCVIAGDTFGFITSVKQTTLEIPQGYVLKQNYPNPFNPTTTIEFEMPQAEVVTIRIYDVLGRQVETLFEGRLDAGTHHVLWNASTIPSGVYFCRMRSRETTLTIKMLLTK